MIRVSSWLLAGIALSTVSGVQAQSAPEPPVAAQKPYEVKAPFGAIRQDPYYWLRDDERKNPEMLAYLEAENAYADAMLAPTKPLQDALYGEITSRIKQDDSSVPYAKDGYYYYDRFETGADYPITARRKGAMTAPEQILLDQPKMAAGKGYFAVGGSKVSPDDRLLAYAEDTVGRRQYVIRVKTIMDGKLLDDAIPNAEPGFAWASDSKTIFYIEKDPTTLLGKRVKAHVLGSPVSSDRPVYEEKDDTFSMDLKTTTSDKYICIVLQSTVSSEERCTPAANPVTFVPLALRKRDFLYSSDHVGNQWTIRTNWQAPNYRLMAVSDVNAGNGRAAWTDIVPTNPEVFIEDFQPFDGFLAIEERAQSNKRLRLLTKGGNSSLVQADEPAYAMALGVNAESATPWVRYTYNSLRTPETTYEVNVNTGERKVLKVQEVKGYDPSRYVTERLWANARDGTKVPVSLIYAKGFKKDGTAPLYQYAYGSYGASSDPSFSPLLPSLLDRGVVYAIAHIRGGQEMGRKWYDDGRLTNKINSFNDFVDVTRVLVNQGYATKDKVAAMGGSAGGLLMGGIANMAPQDYRVIIAQVPFVDAVTTMLDPTIPLTTSEYDEWGNPEQKQWYDVILAYSPYDNVVAKAFPSLFVSTGLWDSQVQYYEPAKWVAKLRVTKTDNNPLVFRVNMEAGHGGKSGRFRSYREVAEYTAFALEQLGVR